MQIRFLGLHLAVARRQGGIRCVESNAEIKSFRTPVIHVPMEFLVNRTSRGWIEPTF
jgi:hypothetical protein